MIHLVLLKTGVIQYKIRYSLFQGGIYRPIASLDGYRGKHCEISAENQTSKFKTNSHTLQLMGFESRYQKWGIN